MSQGTGETPGNLRRQARGADLIIPALAGALVAYFVSDTWNLTWEAKANGVVVGLLLLLLIAIQCGRLAIDVAAGRASLRFGQIAETSPAQLQRLLLVLILILWIATISWLGVTLSLLLVMGSAMYVLGVRSWTTLLFVAVGTAASVHVIFLVILQTRLPRGVIEDLITWLSSGGA